MTDTYEFVRLDAGEVANLGSGPHSVLAGTTATFVADFNTDTGQYEPRPIARPNNSAQLGAGDDRLFLYSGSGAFDGGSGFDIVNLANEPLNRTYYYTFGSGSQQAVGLGALSVDQPYKVAVALGTGSAQFAGVSFEADYSTEDGIFTRTGFGSFSHSLRNFEGVIGTYGDDQLTGSNAEFEILDIGAGGDNELDGRDGIDLAGYGQLRSLGLGVTLDLGAGTARYSAYIERPDRGVGELFDFSDSLANMEGAIGGSGPDTLIGSDDGDYFLGGNSDDTLDGGDGEDTLLMSLAPWMSELAERNFVTPGIEGRGAIVDLLEETARDSFGSIDAVRNFEHVVGTRLDDSITGNDGDNRLFGEDGADALFGGLGDDYIEGGVGIDSLTGGEGEDTFALDETGGDFILDFAFGQDSLLFV